ncbi:DUF4932 domain-containing protein [Mucilaginibacter terrae]|uniref:Arsenate reductase-like glutaredoxin family protein n=1 Tax=Mucilaginibacter terrae TaxID=1955052 RepID=A0ABU3H0G8_9SPHI|nr:DUF4932 domain-containing protein [Mucilaginibacter terrae]MDT3405508.1 arsenate reductase-like glutaredoxin family protein [Mucilaginibacter terrae]
MKLFYKAPLIGTVMLGAVTLATGCKSYNDVTAHYSSKHIKANKNQIRAQIPEVTELGYIVLALTDAGKNYVNTNSPYYDEVVKHFAAFKNHKAVETLNEDLKESPETFTHFRNGLFAFMINKQNRIVVKTDYRIDLNRVDFRRYTAALNDFMEDSKFREFYAAHKSFYSKMEAAQSQSLSMTSAWSTVGKNKNYTKPFQSYQVIMSPLMKGESSTLAISGRGFSECLIFAESTDKALASASDIKVAANSIND